MLVLFTSNKIFLVQTSIREDFFLGELTYFADIIKYTVGQQINKNEFVYINRFFRYNNLDII